ncbi:MAG: histidine phosphatase family protein [Rickettsiales bacterium]|nr:histidine phosphatase family protein [Rickettsiales bacterium]
MKKLYLFRHGETDWNKEGRCQYSIDIELNETGLQQAKENAKFLQNLGIKHIYSSPP